MWFKVWWVKRGKAIHIFWHYWGPGRFVTDIRCGSLSSLEVNVIQGLTSEKRQSYPHICNKYQMWVVGGNCDRNYNHSSTFYFQAKQDTSKLQHLPKHWKFLLQCTLQFNHGQLSGIRMEHSTTLSSDGTFYHIVAEHFPPHVEFQNSPSLPFWVVVFPQYHDGKSRQVEWR